MKKPEISVVITPFELTSYKLSVIFPFGTIFYMFGVVWKKTQVFWSIIISYSINVMNSFLRFQNTTKNFFHNISVFHNISRFLGGWMAIFFNKSISIFVDIKKWSFFGWFSIYPFTFVLLSQFFSFFNKRRTFFKAVPGAKFSFLPFMFKDDFTSRTYMFKHINNYKLKI